MNFRRRRDDEAGINLTPLIDVVFLLLIFFMVSTTFDRHADIQLQLPSADREPALAERAWIDILIDATGEYYVDGQELVNRRPETLERMLEQVLRDRAGDPVLIRADAHASHQSVVTALDVVGRLGITAVSIATIGRVADDD
ncbi:Biopolymer transport protein ExbD/TolR [Thioalkalivibrio nitratireducens DSM 14787]|uniref:Biopolymer transport protein ExbD/TolR n=1 Tax=Thioalkalivibrio nitratireducens (strain DSM 14787 / UNIQEM 213 / ALEN2) TaxID=1255043 RepID=L0DU38_THIND|nr:biopolymer transporter ExbD [Thioalkalivibrio nitratireducens]AGA32527.1 Biopolymer transport protein ExbD/TolR [Thioalkalivibrio nitratireducens DSM 14787]